MGGCKDGTEKCSEVGRGGVPPSLMVGGRAKSLDACTQRVEVIPARPRWAYAPYDSPNLSCYVLRQTPTCYPSAAPRHSSLTSGRARPNCKRCAAAAAPAPPPAPPPAAPAAAPCGGPAATARRSSTAPNCGQRAMKGRFHASAYLCLLSRCSKMSVSNLRQPGNP